MNPMRFFHVGFAAIGLLISLQAQDVTVTAPVPFDEPGTPDAPDKPARPVQAPKPDFPEELRKLDAYNYAIVTPTSLVVITPESEQKNKPSRYAIGLVAETSPAVRKTLFPKLKEWAWTPAIKDGSESPALSWVAIIYNPATATERKKSSAPRLLSVAPVLLPPGKVRPTEGRWPVLMALLSIDESGNIQDTQLASTPQGLSDFSDEIKNALSLWKIAPARKDGVPVAGKIKVPLIFIPKARAVNQKPPSSFPTIFPNVVKKVEPLYPGRLRGLLVAGAVTFEFTMDSEGCPQNPVIVQSRNPEFNAFALDAMLQCRFEPSPPSPRGKFLYTMTFAPPPLRSAPTAGLQRTMFGGMTIAEHREAMDGPKVDTSDGSNLPNVSIPRVRMAYSPVYPYMLLCDKVHGKASATMIVDKTGKVASVEVSDATHPEFALSLVAAADGFLFEPTLKNGQPVIAPVAIEFEFDRSPRNQALKPGDLDVLHVDIKRPDKIVPAGKLDAMPKPLSQQGATFPSAMRNANVTEGTAMIEFLIDEDGWARLPRVVTASTPEFGYAAAHAVAQWRFEQPKLGGKPVTTRMKTPVNFELREK